MSSVILYFIVYHALYFIITAAGVVFATAECRDDDSHLFMFPATDTNVLKSAFWSSGG